MQVSEPFRIAFAPGVTPDKWVRTWRQRYPQSALEVALVETADQRRVLYDGSADMALVRLPIEREGLHLIPLYEEQPVVVVAKEHPVAAYDELPLAELSGEQLVAGEVPGWSEITTVEPLPFPPMSTKDAVEVVASGTGMAILPLSLARLHHRKDVVHRPVLDVPTTQVGLAWLATNDDPRVEIFIGVVRGRRVNSSRGDSAAAPKQESAPKKSGQAARPRSAAKPGAGRQQRVRPAARKPVRKPKRRR